MRFAIRSPWSNKYDPPLDDGIIPSSGLRELEVQANDAFDTYRELYVCSLLPAQAGLDPR